MLYGESAPALPLPPLEHIVLWTGGTTAFDVPPSEVITSFSLLASSSPFQVVKEILRSARQRLKCRKARHPFNLPLHPTLFSHACRLVPLLQVVKELPLYPPGAMAYGGMQQNNLEIFLTSLLALRFRS